MKDRIDRLLTEHGYFSTREKARRAVMAGEVYLGTALIRKPSEALEADRMGEIVVKTRDHAVSRAYYKLKKAAECFSLQIAGRICIDIGSSTGGFTQFLLEQDAEKVYAVDSGTNQLVYALRKDPRVVVMEQTNARYLDPSVFDPVPELAVMDVSFISVTKILPVLCDILRIAEMAVLIKPQFEAGRDSIGKGGIVRDPAVHRAVLQQVLGSATGHGLQCAGLIPSPIRGTGGNIEYLVHWLADSSACNPDSRWIDRVVDEARNAIENTNENGT